MSIGLKKSLKGLFSAGLLVLLAGAGNWAYLSEPKILFLLGIAVVASYYQPDYSPFEYDRQDQGTALQIVWTVFVTQALAMLEAFHFHQPSWRELSLGFYLGAVLCVVGLVLRSWAYLELSESFTWNVRVVDRQRVVGSGPYHLVAHPSYLGALMTYVCTCVLLGAYLAAAFAFVALMFAFTRRIALEERTLLAGLGEPYRLFLRTRKRLIPFIY